MKECSREEVLKGKKSQYDPPNPSRSSVEPGGQRDQEHGVVLHDQEEGYQPPVTSRTGSSRVPQGLSMTPPTRQGGPGGQQDQEHGVVLHDLWEEFINHPQLLEVGVAEYLKEASCFKLRCKPQYTLVLWRSPKSLS